MFNVGGLLYPDSLVGTDSHTTMINGLGVLGWGECSFFNLYLFCQYNKPCSFYIGSFWKAYTRVSRSPLYVVVTIFSSESVHMTFQYQFYQFLCAKLVNHLFRKIMIITECSIATMKIFEGENFSISQVFIRKFDNLYVITNHSKNHM